MFSQRSFPVWIAIILLSGPFLSGCPSMPQAIGQGVLKGAVLDPSERLHVVFEDAGGVKYGVHDGFVLASGLVTSEGSLGGPSAPPYAPGFRDVLALDPQGKPYILYYFEEQLFLTRKEAGEWQSYLIGDATIADFYGSSSLTLDDAGVVHIGFASYTPSMDAVELFYAKWEEGSLTVEQVDTVASSLIVTFIAPRIELGMDQRPVIAFEAGQMSISGEYISDSVRVAERTEGSGWEVEEIFYNGHEYPSDPGWVDISFAVSPTGERAVGFSSVEWPWGSMNFRKTTYVIMADSGTGWTEEKHHEVDCGYVNRCLLPFESQDIAFDNAGRLYAMYTDEWYEEGTSLRQDIYLDTRTGSEWQSRLLWDNTLYDARMCHYGIVPNLFLTSASKVKMIYNSGATWQTQTLMLLAE